mmetsp:Transcript_50607/g.91278  ORF Transcript_50607/g.91278 Transcript_50607/m.91278 type:complete len:217 (-) Transcript_50607:55-705(-)
MIRNRVTNLVATKRSMLFFENGHQRIQLHNVMDHSEHNHGQRPFDIMATLLLEYAGLKKEMFKLVPVCLCKKILSFFDFVGLPCRSLRVCRQRIPFIVNSKAERLFAIRLQAHQPIDSKQCPERSLVLIICAAAATCCGLTAPICHIQSKLRKSCNAILVKLLQFVAGVTDVPGSLLSAAPVPLFCLHDILQKEACSLNAVRHLERLRCGKPRPRL